jgi:hypothetical protein
VNEITARRAAPDSRTLQAENGAETNQFSRFLIEIAASKRRKKNV